MQLLPRLNQGGVENMVVALNRGLVARGIDSVVVSGGGALADVIAADGGRHVPCAVAGKNIFTAWHRAMALRRLVLELRPNVLHVHSRVPMWLLRLAGMNGLPPVVSTVHGFHNHPWYSNVLLLADRVICPCTELYDSLGVVVADAGSLRLLPNGIDVDSYNPSAVTTAQCSEMRSRLGLDDAAVVITMPGRFSSNKGHALLLEAFRLLFDSGRADGVKLLLVGNTSAKPALVASLRELCAGYGIVADVVFASDVAASEMPVVLAISDVLVSASLRPEGFGLTIVEAHAMNRPVVAAAHGGAMDLLVPGENGELFAVGDSVSLAASLHAALNRRQWKLESMRARVCAQYSVQRMLDATVAVYQELLP